MEIIRTIQEMRSRIQLLRQENIEIGFVPTMGALHKGHQSLITKATKENDVVVVSIFVNPTQFGPTEDLDKYPRDIEGDTQKCLEAGAHIIFAPSVEEMYPEKSTTMVMNPSLANALCGYKRPGHFDGVCLIVSKLFHVVSANKAYFGEKDFQQLAIIKKMVFDLNIEIDIIGCPIVREVDGLAMSSRNRYLTTDERAASPKLYESLKLAKNLIQNAEASYNDVKSQMMNVIGEIPNSKIDYIEIVNRENLQPTEERRNILVALAVYVGKARLIDNIQIN